MVRTMVLFIVLTLAGVARAQDLPRMRPIWVVPVQAARLGGVGPRVWVGRVDTLLPAGPSGVAQGTIIRVAFEPGWVIGEHSSVDLVSVLDGATQHLTGQSLAEWSGASAAFNGSQVDVFVNTSGPDDPTSFSIAQALVYDGAVATTRSICGGSDDRTLSNDPNVGRLSLICSAFVLNTGVFVTAKHCQVQSGDFVEFNVPSSWGDGTPRAASPSDQYPVNIGTLTNSPDASDWAIFRTNGSPGGGYAVYLVVDGVAPGMTATGYGIDSSPGPRNSASQTQQSAVTRDLLDGQGGLYTGVSAEPGGAGSVVRKSDGAGAVALLATTNTNCSADYIPLWTGSINTALGTFPAGMVFVSLNAPGPTWNGTAGNPFPTIGQGLSAVPQGGRLGIFSASQGYPGNMTINRPCTIVPVNGPVTIGH